MTNSNFSQLNSGDTISTFVRPANLDTWNHYAAVNDEFVPFHMDDEAAREIGFPSAFGMGNLLLAYAHELVRRNMGPEDTLEKLDMRFDQPALRGTTVTVSGEVSATSDGATGRTVELRIGINDDNDRRLATADARVRTTVALDGQLLAEARSSWESPGTAP
jgi:acyl dehydratase